MSTTIIICIIIGALLAPRFTACMLLLYLVFVLTGCSTLPEMAQDCVETEKYTIAECQAKVLRREDRQFKRDQDELRKAACVMPYMWDNRNERCFAPDGFIIRGIFQ